MKTPKFIINSLKNNK